MDFNVFGGHFCEVVAFWAAAKVQSPISYRKSNGFRIAKDPSLSSALCQLEAEGAILKVFFCLGRSLRALFELCGVGPGVLESCRPQQGLMLRNYSFCTSFSSISGFERN